MLAGNFLMGSSMKSSTISFAFKRVNCIKWNVRIRRCSRHLNNLLTWSFCLQFYPAYFHLSRNRQNRYWIPSSKLRLWLSIHLLLRWGIAITHGKECFGQSHKNVHKPRALQSIHSLFSPTLPSFWWNRLYRLLWIEFNRCGQEWVFVCQGRTYSKPQFRCLTSRGHTQKIDQIFHETFLVTEGLQLLHLQ